jgi:hypothetical protein
LQEGSFGVVAFGVTAALAPYIWPSVLVGLPVGAIAGVAVAVPVDHLFTTRRERPDRQGGTPGEESCRCISRSARSPDDDWHVTDSRSVFSSAFAT